MQHFRSLNGLNLRNAWCAIGSFDGVHLGHQAVIHSLVTAARAAAAPSLVITFYPHPVVVLRGISAPFYLTSADERASLLGSLGVDVVLTLPFDRDLAAQPAEDFMQAVSAAAGLACLYVGQDFALGRGRSGDVSALRQIGARLGYQVQLIPPIASPQGVISSSQIRSLLQQGSVESAAQLLGRPYFVEAEVVHGQQRGRSIGIPTANLGLPAERLLPANGVYATWAWVGGTRRPAVTNIGVRPTFEHQAVFPRAEAHLLDFNGDLYGQSLRLEFIARLRGEQPFSSVQALQAQIETDISQTREVLRHA